MTMTDGSRNGKVTVPLSKPESSGPRPKVIRSRDTAEPPLPDAARKALAALGLPPPGPKKPSPRRRATMTADATVDVAASDRDGLSRSNELTRTVTLLQERRRSFL